MEEFPKKELETLWAPWRVEYFEKEPRDLNFFSEAAQASDDAAHLVITRRKNTFLMMNRPVTAQFWLDVGSSGWHQRLAQPLDHL